MKKILVVLLLFFLFLVTPFYQTKIFAQTQPVTTETQTTQATTVATPQPNLWDMFWSWVAGIFTKTDYTITSRPSSEVNSDMTSYGDKNDPSFSEKHSFAGSRSTDALTQNCYKGTVIKKVILDTPGYPNSNISKICFDSANKCVVKSLNIAADTITSENLTNCTDKTIKDLAQYFVQLNQKFYCDANNKLIDIEETVKNKFSSETPTIPSNELTCYQEIYNDFYLTPPETSDNEEENTKKMIQTPISGKDQTNGSNKDVQKQLNQNFSPEGSSAGLSGLRPESDK